MRKFIIAANWKMYKSPSEALSFFKDFIAESTRRKLQTEILFFVPSVDLWVTQEFLRGTALRWGAQNCHFEAEGAFTGETSPKVLAEILTPYCLVGHSERRLLFHESDADTARKISSLHKFNITPMLCVGETLTERESGQTATVICRQLRIALEGADALKPLILAYEPVWAIGTGRVATVAQACEAHQILRNELRTLWGAAADKTSVLYGGSVKADNASSLAAQDGIDGFLVGGASLTVSGFLDVINAAKAGLKNELP